MFNSIKFNNSRKQFFDDLKTKDIEIVLKKYFPNNLKCKVEKYTRLFLIKTGIYKNVIKVGKKIRKRD